MNTKVPNIDYNEAIKSSGLFRKLGFVLFAVIVYRLGTYVPVPGINSAVLEQIFAQHQNGILGIFDMFSGGALMRMSVFTLGVMPYISASIIMTLMQSSFDSLKVALKYVHGNPVINEINRVSKPGRRVYSSIKNLQKTYNGLGISILSTPRGVMSDNEAREANVGGEVLCTIY